MLRFSFWISGAVVLTAALWLTGCGSDNGHDDNGGGADHSSHDQGKGGGSKIEANLAKLSAEDRALVEKQKLAPSAVIRSVRWPCPSSWTSTANPSSFAARVVKKMRASRMPTVTAAKTVTKATTTSHCGHRNGSRLTTGQTN